MGESDGISAQGASNLSDSITKITAWYISAIFDIHTTRDALKLLLLLPPIAKQFWNATSSAGEKQHYKSYYHWLNKWVWLQKIFVALIFAQELIIRESQWSNSSKVKQLSLFDYVTIIIEDLWSFILIHWCLRRKIPVITKWKKNWVAKKKNLCWIPSSKTTMQGKISGILGWTKVIL